MSKVWVAGNETSAEEADRCLSAVLKAMGSPEVLVAPWDKPVQAGLSNLEHLATSTDWGVAVATGASCRWRSDGRRAIVTVVASSNLEIGELESHEVGDVKDRTLRMFPRYVKGTAFAGGLVETTYSTKDLGDVCGYALPDLTARGGGST